MKCRLGENLEMVIDPSGTRSVNCMQCGTSLGASPTDWQEKAKTWTLPTAWAGPLMSGMDGHLEQLLCPSCGALFETKLKEVEAESR